jgi:predicted hotdog family 3-hydroxylacyl-ACP dehydratase
VNTPNDVTVDKSEIRKLIPHSGLMCLLDEVVNWDDQSIICRSNSHRDPANPLWRNEHLSALHAFEYGAQAVAVHGALRARSAEMTAPPGYLAALRDANLHVPRLDDLTSPLQIRAKRLFADNANSVYECRISAGDVLVAEGRVTIILRS